MTAVDLSLPDLGPAQYLPADVEGGYVGNAAAMMEIALDGARQGNKRCIIMVQAFRSEWDRLADSDLTDGRRGGDALIVALNEVFKAAAN